MRTTNKRPVQGDQKRIKLVSVEHGKEWVATEKGTLKIRCINTFKGEEL